MSLLQRLVLLVLLLIVPILSIELVNNIYLRNERVAAVHSQAEQLAVLVDDEHARITEGVRQLLSTWAESPVLRTRDMAGCQEMAERLRVNYPAYLVVGTTDGDLLGLDLGDRFGGAEERLGCGKSTGVSLRYTSIRLPPATLTYVRYWR